MSSLYQTSFPAVRTARVPYHIPLSPFPLTEIFRLSEEYRIFVFYFLRFFNWLGAKVPRLAFGSFINFGMVRHGTFDYFFLMLAFFSLFSIKQSAVYFGQYYNLKSVKPHPTRRKGKRKIGSWHEPFKKNKCI